MKVSLWVSPVVSAVVLFGSVGVATSTGAWVTGGREQVSQSTRLTVDDLKGWMTLQQAADGLGIPVATLIELLDAPHGVSLAPSTPFKEVEGQVPGFELATFRGRLRDHLAGGQPALPVPEPSAGRR
ncbi:MAG: hypothetical protein IT193_01420 [Propionibacteriaceae bacterium]|nr:hypothetical protein [Propionibacteriaceae bacterium]